MSKQRPSCLFLIILLVPLIFTGCETTQNQFARFYRNHGQTIITNLPPWSGHTSIYGIANRTNDVKALDRKGFALLGESAFQGAGITTEQMLHAQARKVGADVVLYSSTYLGSQQAAMPYVQYNPGQTYTTTSSGNVNASAWGNNGGYAYGVGNYYGTSTTTTPGTFSTQVIPVTLQHYSHDALFFRKRKPPVLGTTIVPLTEELKTKLQRNSGVVVWTVTEDSPAFRANILEGDVILKIGGEDIFSLNDFGDKMAKFEGQKVEIQIWRESETKTIALQLNFIEHSSSQDGK